MIGRVRQDTFSTNPTNGHENRKIIRHACDHVACALHGEMRCGGLSVRWMLRALGWMLCFVLQLDCVQSFRHFTTLAAVAQPTAMPTHAVPMQHPVRGVLFKLEGTMVDTRALHLEAYEHALAAVPFLSKVATQKPQLLYNVVGDVTSNGSRDQDVVLRVFGDLATADELKLLCMLKDQKYSELRTQLKPVVGLKPLVRFLRRHGIPTTVTVRNA